MRTATSCAVSVTSYGHSLSQQCRRSSLSRWCLGFSDLIRPFTIATFGRFISAKARRGFSDLIRPFTIATCQADLPARAAPGFSDLIRPFTIATVSYARRGPANASFSDLIRPFTIATRHPGIARLSFWSFSDLIRPFTIATLPFAPMARFGSRVSVTSYGHSLSQLAPRINQARRNQFQ